MTGLQKALETGRKNQKAIDGGHTGIVGTQVAIVIATNQDNGIVSYMQGYLWYRKQHSAGNFLLPEGFISDLNRDEPVKVYFSDRTDDNPWDPQNDPIIPTPFADDKIDHVRCIISIWGDTVSMTFILLNWGNATYTVPLQEMGNILIGIGAPIGNNTSQAVYTVSFRAVLTVESG